MNKKIYFGIEIRSLGGSKAVYCILEFLGITVTRILD
jgi:hypothetical protein